MSRIYYLKKEQKTKLHFYSATVVSGTKTNQRKKMMIISVPVCQDFPQWGGMLVLRSVFELYDLVMREEQSGGKHLPRPSVQQRSVPAERRHKPGHGHASCNRPDPEVSHLLWSSCYKVHPPLQTSAIFLVPHWAQPCLSLSPSSSGPTKSERGFLVCAVYFVALASLQIMWDLSQPALLLREVSSKFKWHKGLGLSQSTSAGGKIKAEASRVERRAALSGELSILYWSSF